MKPETISLIANICTIVSSFSIVIALYIYIKDKIDKNKKFDFTKKSKRASYIKILSENPLLIDKVTVGRNHIKGKSLSEILLKRYTQAIEGDREVLLKNGLKFLLSNESIQAFKNFNADIYNNFDTIIFRFCSLVIDKDDFYTNNSKKIDAWIELENIKQFIIKFPIPVELLDDKVFSDIRFGQKTISALGNEVMHSYFLPYLILYIARNYRSITKEDTYRIFSVVWEIGPS